MHQQQQKLRHRTDSSPWFCCCQYINIHNRFPLLIIQYKPNYGKPCSNGHSKIDKTKILMTNGSLMKVESIAECPPLEHPAILLTFIKRLLVLKTNFMSFWEWLFYTGFTVLYHSIAEHVCHGLVFGLCWLHFFIILTYFLKASPCTLI